MTLSKIAFVFPGQGSQIVGMGKDIAELSPAAREVFEQADEVLGYSLSRLCFEGPEADLNDTAFTQPALYVCGIATLRALQAMTPQISPASMAGHSLGELTALAAAGAYSFIDGLQLVRVRGRVMREAGEKSPGAMAALLGLDTSSVRDVCAQAAQETDAVLVLANDNCPGQTVISGEAAAIDRAIDLAKAAGARRAIRLAVSIAAHSPLMAPAAAEFAEALQRVDFRTPSVPVIANVSVTPLSSSEAIQHELAMQLTQPVRWTETIEALAAADTHVFVEMGPKDVLTGLIKRIDSGATTYNLNNAANLLAFVQQMTA